jgi:putative membrane protein
MRIAMWVGTAVVTMSVGAAYAQTSATMNPDQRFVMNALKGGMAEVELGRLAADKGTSDEVKRFGQRMADDHSKAGDELKALAERKNIAPPTEIDAHDKALEAKLKGLSGTAFDQAYMEAMVNDHVKDVSEFRTESKSGRDGDVKAWAAKTLPTLEDHLKQARETHRDVVGTSGKK